MGWVVGAAWLWQINVIANHCHCKVYVSAQQSIMVLSQGRVSLEQRLGIALQTAILLILSLSLSFSAVAGKMLCVLSLIILCSDSDLL